MNTVTLLAVKLPLEALVLSTKNVLAIAPSADAGGERAVKAATAVGGGRGTGSGAAPATVVALSGSSATSATGAGGDVRALGDRSRGGGGETGRRRAVAVASGSWSRSSPVELLRSRSSRLLSLAGAEVGGNVSRAGAVGLGAKVDTSCISQRYCS